MTLRHLDQQAAATITALHPDYRDMTTQALLEACAIQGVRLNQTHENRWATFATNLQLIPMKAHPDAQGRSAQIFIEAPKQTAKRSLLLTQQNVSVQKPTIAMYRDGSAHSRCVTGSVVVVYPDGYRIAVCQQNITDYYEWRSHNKVWVVNGHIVSDQASFPAFLLARACAFVMGSTAIEPVIIVEMTSSRQRVSVAEMQDTFLAFDKAGLGYLCSTEQREAMGRRRQLPAAYKDWIASQEQAVASETTHTALLEQRAKTALQWSATHAAKAPTQPSTDKPFLWTPKRCATYLHPADTDETGV